jgi:hypothetical protein
MASAPSVAKKTLRVLLILLGVAVVFGGYFYLRLTADVELAGVQPPNGFDAQEAARKLKLFEQAKEGARKGFIRLTEVELNSYLRERYLGGFGKTPSASAAATNGLLDCRLDLATNRLTLFCWLEKERWKQRVGLCWTRTFGVARTNDRWTLNLQAMRIGDLDVPPRWWPRVQAALGQVDEVFTAESAWAAQLPAVELRANEFSQSPELRLYTYPEPAAWPRATNE